MEEIDFTYDIITSARTLHNFTWENKQKVFEKIYANLSKNGKMLCMDKIYTDDPKEREKMLKTQLARYRYLDEQLRKDITDHEYQDLTDDYRMDESPTIEVLKKIGFRSIKIIDRVERDVIVVAEK